MKQVQSEYDKLYRIAAAQAAQYKDLDLAAQGVQAYGYPERLSKLAIVRVSRMKTGVETGVKNP